MATGSTTVKRSYTVPCASDLRDAVTDLAQRKGVNVGDLARSLLLTVTPDDLRALPDPGGPAPGDREEIILKSGPSKGRPWRRKPRLQVRMAPGYDIADIRRALALCLAIDRGDMVIRPQSRTAIHADGAARGDLDRLKREVRDQRDQFLAIISVLSPPPLKQGITSREDALHVLGFAPSDRPSGREIRARFRMLATIHHPDADHGDHGRMAQLNAAMDRLSHVSA